MLCLWLRLLKPGFFYECNSSCNFICVTGIIFRNISSFTVLPKFPVFFCVLHFCWCMVFLFVVQLSAMYTYFMCFLFSPRGREWMGYKYGDLCIFEDIYPKLLIFRCVAVAGFGLFFIGIVADLSYQSVKAEPHSEWV